MSILTIIQAIVAVLLIAIILIQKGESSLGSAFGASDSFQMQKRGPEKVFFYATIILSILFLGLAFASLLTA